MTLLGFGLTLPWIIRRTGLSEDTTDSVRSEAMLVVRDVHRQAVSALREDNAVDEDLLRRMEETLKRLAKREGGLAGLLGASGRRELDPNTGQPMDPVRLATVRYFEAMRDALADERSLGAYSTESIAQVQEVLDLEELRRTR